MEPEDKYYFLLPKTTLDKIVRLLFAPLLRGESETVLFAAGAGRRAVTRFLLENLDKFTDIIPRKPDRYYLYFIDPVELVEKSPLDYMLLFYNILASSVLPAKTSYRDVFLKTKNVINKLQKEREMVFFLNRFDELEFMDETLGNNLRALIQINKPRIHFVFLPMFPIPQNVEIYSRYGRLREILWENEVIIPPLTDTDINYVVDRQEFLCRTRFSLTQRAAIKDVSAGNPRVLKVACRLISGQSIIKNPRDFLENHPLILAAKRKRQLPNYPLTIDAKTGIIKYGDKVLRLPLSGTEQELMVLFLKRKNEIITREEVALVLWGKNNTERYSDWALDQAICAFREKLSAIDKESNLITIRGKGYRFWD